MTDDPTRWIVYEGDGLIVVDKPAGLPSTGWTLADPDCVQHLLQRRYRRRIWAVHQLDRGTTGLNLFVRRKALVSWWAEALRVGRKRYLAVVHGEVAWPERRIEHPLGWIEAERRRGVTPGGQPALSHARRLGTWPGGSLVEVWIETGRTHQVRLHLAAEGHPLVGEQRYRDPPCEAFGRVALHAAEISAGGKRFEAPMPRDMQRLIETCPG